MKPPYRVPSMAEIAEIPWNGYNVISTFSGGGGSSLGYRLAGYRVLWANEVDQEAQNTYNANKAPYTTLDGRDIRKVTGKDILEAIGLQQGELDLFDSSPPCVSFSTAGKREKHWGKEKEYGGFVQRVDDLSFEFTRLLGELQPKTFVMENVSGLVKGTAKGYFKWILATTKAAGYRVQAKLLNAQWLGVPQDRQRIIFIGVREDLGLDPIHPDPLPYRYSVRDAIPWIISTGSIRETGFQAKKPMVSSDEPSPTILAGGGNGMNTSQFGVEAETDISRYAIGAEWDSRGQYGKKSNIADSPAPTVIATSTGTHIMKYSETEKRKFSIAELKRICSFPDDYILTGSYSQQWMRLGNAVPPVMMQHIASAVRDGVLNKL